MHITSVNFDKVSALSYKDVFYQNDPEKLSDFYSFKADLEGLRSAIDSRINHKVDRKLLKKVFESQYNSFLLSTAQQENIKLIEDEKTFTIITAHQPSLLGGPAYYFYKICSAINLARKLKQTYHEFNFIPVFISGSEDHDFDEIKSINLFNKTIECSVEQNGPVGRLKNLGLKEIITQAGEILGNSNDGIRIKKIFDDALESSEIYKSFVLNWVNAFFKDYGLLVLDMDVSVLKKAFIPIMKKELLERPSEKLVNDTQNKLLDFNFKPQAFAREINLFYISDFSRERIYFEDGKYKINNSDLEFSDAEIIA